MDWRAWGFIGISIVDWEFMINLHRAKIDCKPITAINTKKEQMKNIYGRSINAVLRNIKYYYN